MAGFAKGSNLRAQLAAHNHDGSNSEAVSAGTPAAGSLAASAGGRAIMAANYFDAATVLAKFAANAITNANTDAIFAAEAWAADADSRAKFADGIWTPAKLADTAKTHILTYQIEDLAAGVDIDGRVIFVVPAGLTVTITGAMFIPQGSAAGVDDSNNCVIGINNGANSIASAAFDSDPAFPAADAATSLGELSATHKVMEAGAALKLNVTNGTTANPPAMMLQVTYTVADAA